LGRPVLGKESWVWQWPPLTTGGDSGKHKSAEKWEQSPVNSLLCQKKKLRREGDMGMGTGERKPHNGLPMGEGPTALAGGCGHTLDQAGLITGGSESVGLNEKHRIGDIAKCEAFSPCLKPYQKPLGEGERERSRPFPNKRNYVTGPTLSSPREGRRPSGTCVTRKKERKLAAKVIKTS